jgi:hypothetical protein
MNYESGDILCGDAADEIERLQKKENLLLEAGDRLEQQLVTVAQQRDAMRLTAAEREAIDWAAYAAEQWYEHTAADTLRGLLARLG